MSEVHAMTQSVLRSRPPALLFALLCAVGVLLARPAHAGENPGWDADALRADLDKGLPLVVHVTVALCDNKQVDCGSGIAGRPGNLSHNLYWGAIFGARRFLDRKQSAFRRISVGPVDDVVLERAVYRRWVAAKQWRIARTQPVEQIVVLDAVHGEAIDRAVSGFWSRATAGGDIGFADGDVERRVRPHIAGYVGHNRLMDGLSLPKVEAGLERAVPSFVLACHSESYFSGSLRRAGSRPLVMTRALMAPEGYVLEAVLTAIGDGVDEKEMRRRAVAAYAKWQRLSPGVASGIFAPR